MGNLCDIIVCMLMEDIKAKYLVKYCRAFLSNFLRKGFIMLEAVLMLRKRKIMLEDAFLILPGLHINRLFHTLRLF